jgi:LPS sulfotransferase NodH
LWSQSFLEEVQGYSYDFDDIALVMRDSERLMSHWRKFHAGSMRDVQYEQLAADSETVIAQLAAWLGLPAQNATPKPASTISTASLWQARQPVYTRSVERWRSYAEFLPELLKFPAE